MIGTVINTCAILVGTSIGCLLRSGLKEKYHQVLFLAMGLAAFGIGLENLTNAMPKSHYHVLFIVSLAIGALLGTWWQIDKKFNALVTKYSQSQVGQGLATGVLLYCFGALSIVGPVMAAVKADYTMLFTNATLDFVTSIIFGASFGWGMLLGAPVLFCWQGSIYLIAKFLSASFFSGPLVVELTIIGGFLITASGISLLKLREIKTLNFLPALFVPVIFFLVKGWLGW
ncbi:DUF554 domain-containing protein [Ligilactobacillus agilis]|uniref:DUF554 domain-containing protein n=1 Tax=Ligilactobacillus agilis TaxID=1601 RepID=UPI00265D31ED|nr:DUF554 domain-containing protein [Ligilactobacillus agilis]